MLCADPRIACAAYPAYSPAKVGTAPVGQLSIRWCFAIALMAVGLMSWANRLRNVPVEKLCCRPGYLWKQGCLPLSPETWPPCQMLFRATVFLAFHRLFIRVVSRTRTPTDSFSAVIEKFCPIPCSPKRAVLL